jgi:hypothetical protein
MGACPGCSAVLYRVPALAISAAAVQFKYTEDYKIGMMAYTIMA